MTRLLLLILLLSFLGKIQVVAETNNSGSKPFVINYKKSEYHADNQNWSVSTDNSGVVYFGNHAGLLSFDGSNWDLINLPVETVVRSVNAESGNRIYVGAYEEFGYFKINNKGQKRYISLSDSIDQNLLHNDEIWRIIKHKGNVYFQSFNSIYVYDGEHVELINPETTVVLLQKARNRLFIHKIGQGLFEIKNKSLVFIDGSQFLRNDEVKMVIPFAKEKFLIGAANSGLYVYDGEGFKSWDIPMAESIRDAEINCGIALENTIAIGTIVNGIYILNTKGGLHSHLNTENDLQNNTVLSMAADDSGNLWAGLDRGIDCIDLDPAMDFYIDKSGRLGSVYAATIYNGYLWVGTNRGLYKYNKTKGNTFSNPQMIEGSQGQVWSLDVFDNQLICGHNNGTFTLSSSDTALTKISNINGGFNIEKVSFNNVDVLLQSTYSNLVIYKKQNNQWKFSNIVEGFIEPVPDFELDHKGNIWASHLNAGVFKIQLNQSLDSVSSVQFFNKSSGFDNDREVHVSKVAGRIVFATGSSLFTYDDLNDTLVRYKRLNQQAKSFKNAQKIAHDDDNNYWFVNKNQIGLFKIKSGTFSQLFNYNLYQQGLYMSSEYPEIIMLDENKHLICLDNGFAIYQHKEFEMINTGTVLMREVTAKDNQGETKYLTLNQTTAPIALPYNFRNISFTFSTTERYDNPLYRYKLKGLEKNDFTKWNNESVVTFNRLPAGEYVFIAQSKNVYGKVSNTLTYSFEILPPWYASNSAFIIYSLIFIGLIIYFRHLFLLRLRKHAGHLEKEEKQKRERERMISHQQLMKVKNEKLQAELKHKNVELANHTMNIINKNDLLIKIKMEIKNLKKELGPRLPNYHYRKILKTIDQNISSEDEWKTFEAHFDEIHENFFKRLMDQYPDLTQSDLKLCAYLRMNLSTKEIAPLLNISIRGVEARRYRLRKRLNLSHDANLVEFLLQF